MSRTTGYEPLNVPKPFGPEIWIVDGPHIRFYGLPFSTRMTLVRLPSGGLWVHSPIKPDERLLARVKELGPVAHLVAPNAIHYAYLGDWQARFPEAQAWVAPGVRARAIAHKVELGPAEELSAGAGWEGMIDSYLVRGSKVLQEAVFFHAPSRTVVLTDFIENFEPGKLPWLFGRLVRLLGMTTPDGRMPPDMYATFDKAELRRSVEAILAWAPERAVLAHGAPYDARASARIRRVFRRLLDAS
ncbi:DUF4336 domain-containing protein [Ferrimonas balearica]|nr:DUF4336 domain-containing protein [Ferrimonas balearica]